MQTLQLVANDAPMCRWPGPADPPNGAHPSRGLSRGQWSDVIPSHWDSDGVPPATAGPGGTTSTRPRARSNQLEKGEFLVARRRIAALVLLG